jgi:hypothetical protein
MIKAVPCYNMNEAENTYCFDKKKNLFKKEMTHSEELILIILVCFMDKPHFHRKIRSGDIIVIPI